MVNSLPIPLVLLTIPATACTAFLHSIHINTRNHSPTRETIFTINQSSKHVDDSIRVDQLNNLLEEKRQELLSEKSSKLLEQQYPKSTIAVDNETREALSLTTEQNVREVLLSSRLDLPFLHRTTIGPSNIDGAGRGLFAAEDIMDGEVITCYPGDVLMYDVPSSYDDEDGCVESIALWGAHVPEQHVWDDDAVFDGTESQPPLTSYVLSVDDHYSVMGHPSLDDNPAYYGHFANDGAGHLALEKANSPANIQAAIELGLAVPGDDDYDDGDLGIGVEDNIAAYVLKSLEMANAMHKSPDEGESHMVTVATRDIKEGEEIFVTYGPDYWAGYDSN